MAPISKKASRFINFHIRKHRREGMQEDQAVAAAFSEARGRGFKVPKANPHPPKEVMGTVDAEVETPEGIGVKVKRKPPGNPHSCPACHGVGLVHA